MTFPSILKLAAIVIATALGVAVFAAWRAEQRDRAQLATELAATKKLLADAGSRQHERDAQLAKTLAGLAKERQSFTTPVQIVHDLPKLIPLPAPILLKADHTNSVEKRTPEAASVPPSNLTPPTTSQATHFDRPVEAVIPIQDLKPLYDFALDCKACQARLAATQSDLTDERTKTTALVRERDAALRIARGGSAWHRITRAAKWFALGAATGAVLARAKR